MKVNNSRNKLKRKCTIVLDQILSRIYLINTAFESRKVRSCELLIVFFQLVFALSVSGSFFLTDALLDKDKQRALIYIFKQTCL